MNEQEDFIKRLFNDTNKFSLQEKSSLIELYYSDKKTVENYTDFHDYMRPKITEYLKEDTFLFFQLEKIEDTFNKPTFFKVDANENFAFMSALNVNIRAVQVQQLLGFLFDFEEVFLDMPQFKLKIVNNYIGSFCQKLQEAYGEEMFKRPYFSSMSSIYKKLLKTKSLLSNGLDEDTSDKASEKISNSAKQSVDSNVSGNVSGNINVNGGVNSVGGNSENSKRFSSKSNFERPAAKIDPKKFKKI